MPPLNLVFMGTPRFAVAALDALQQAGHTILAVYCQPPRPAKRGQKVQKTPVHQKAEALGIPVRTPETLHDRAEHAFLSRLKIDAVVVVAYGLIVPPPILALPRLGCLNIHASLLPRWRGAAPIQRALLAGDAETGVTIMLMDTTLDTGSILEAERIPISPQATTPRLHDVLAEHGAQLIVKTLEGLDRGAIVPQPQPTDRVTYASKLKRTEGQIDWTQAATALDLRVRALNPWPGTFFLLNGQPIKLLRSQVVAGKSALPGTLLDTAFTVACGSDALRLLTLQRPGKEPTTGEDLLRGLRLPMGFRLPANP